MSHTVASKSLYAILHIGLPGRFLGEDPESKQYDKNCYYFYTPCEFHSVSLLILLYPGSP